MADQLSLLDDAWLQRGELRDFIHFMSAADERGHLHEAPYDYRTSWPRLVSHKKRGTCLAWLQRAHRSTIIDGARMFYLYSRERSPERCNVWRFIFTDHEGVIVDESAWCTTEGGARGYLNRARLTFEQTAG